MKSGIGLGESISSQDNFLEFSHGSDKVQIDIEHIEALRVLLSILYVVFKFFGLVNIKKSE